MADAVGTLLVEATREGRKPLLRQDLAHRGDTERGALLFERLADLVDRVVALAQPDDLFVAYTDGITDWENAAGEMWGSERLENTLQTLCDLTPRQVVQRIIEEVSAFATGGSQRDDAALVVVHVDRDGVRRT